MRPAESFGLNGRQAAAATLIASGMSCKGAAAKIGLSERYVQEMARKPACRAYIAHLQGLTIRRSIGRLTRASVKAVRRLVALVDSQDEGVALRASTAILDVLIRMNEHADLAARVAELESLAPPTNGRPS